MLDDKTVEIIINAVVAVISFVLGKLLRRKPEQK